MDMWNSYGIKLNGWDFTPTRAILTATVICMCFTCLCGEAKRGLSMSHDSNSFNIMVQTNNYFTPSQTSPGLTMSAPHAVALGYVSGKWATEAKQRHWNTQDNKEVMTCYSMSNLSERG